MNTRTIRRFLSGLAVLCLAASCMAAAEVHLAVVQFPERSSVDLDMVATTRVAPAKAEASVKFKDGQAQVEVDSKNLPPAVVFGGNVTSFVAWAVARDGNAENLGELIVRDPKGSAEYRTGQKEFGLLITAESSLQWTYIRSPTPASRRTSTGRYGAPASQRATSRSTRCATLH